jgi:hypothetical protein
MGKPPIRCAGVIEVSNISPKVKIALIAFAAILHACHGTSTREDLSADPADRRRRTFIARGYG